MKHVLLQNVLLLFFHCCRRFLEFLLQNKKN